MADFNDKAESSRAAVAKPQADSATPSGKSALRRKVVGRGQTSLSSASPVVLPDASKPATQPATLPNLVAPSPAASAKPPVSAQSTKDTPVTPVVDAAQPAPVPAPAASTPAVAPAPAPRDEMPDLTNAAPEVPLKRGVGRPRKVALGASSPTSANTISANTAPGKRQAAKPSLAKPVVAKPHPIEPATKPVPVKAPRINAAVAANQPAGKVAASAAAASRPALRAARIINSVSTPNPTPPSGTSIKDLTMDMSANFNGFQGAMSEAQAKAQAAFEKSSNMLGEAGDFAKGNVEAMVESTKILAEGVQEIGSTIVAESRTAFESMTGDIKELAAAKSPTDFFKLQSDLVRKNFDNAMSYSSKNSETFLKLMSEAFAPLSGRVSLAVEKARKVAPMSAPTDIAA